MQPVLKEYLEELDWPEARKTRMVNGLRVLQDIAAHGHQPVTYARFAQRVQPKLAALATGPILEDIGQFCNSADWPNLTCFVVSAATGECSDGFRKLSNEDPAKARDSAWFAYSVYKTGPRVDLD